MAKTEKTRAHAKEVAWNLGAFSASLEDAAKRRQDEHKKFNDNLPEPDLFLPEEEDPKCGLGWFVRPDGWAVSYRKHHNGYEGTPSSFLHKDTITALHKAFKSKEKSK